MRQHPEGDTPGPATPDHSGQPPNGAAAPDPRPVTPEPTRASRTRKFGRWWIAGELTLVLAVPVGIGVAAAAGGSPPATGAGTGTAAHMSGTASCPATCGSATARGIGQHMSQMPHNPADIAEHQNDMMAGRGAMMLTPTAAPSSP